MQRYRVLYARLFLAMSVEEARQTLGFPPGYTPSPVEIQKAYRTKAIENHPDRGGSHEKMVEVNVAKEILEGKRHDRYSPPKRDPEEERRREQERKRAQALTTVDQAAKQVGDAAESAMRNADIGYGKLHLRDFFSEDYAEAIDKIQNQIDDAPSAQKRHPDWQKADVLCQSLSNKALRLGKRYLALQKMQGELTAGLLGMGGSKPITFNTLADLYSEKNKFITTFASLHEESRKLVGLINTSEALPTEWDDFYYRSHSIIDSFKTDFSRASDIGLQQFKSVLERNLKLVGDAVLDVNPADWKKAPGWDDWRYPEDFEWAKDAIKDPSTKSASMVERVRRRWEA